MEAEDALTTNRMQADTSSPTNMSTMSLNYPSSSPRFGTVTPNSIFIRGIDFKTNEYDLCKFFAQYGSVKEVKIISGRTGVSKRYGFITFETQEDAQKILRVTGKLNYKGKKMDVGPAIRKQRIRSPPEADTMYLTTSSGYPYVYHNGVAYFHKPEVASVTQPWPCQAVSSSPLMATQLVYESPVYHCQAPTQCLPTQCQYFVPQFPSPLSAPSSVYLQPSEVIYQPIGITQASACVPPPLLVEAPVAELCSDHGGQALHHQLYAQSALAMPVPMPRVA